MLKAMRKNLKSLAPTLWIVIAAFIIAIFAVWGGAGRLGEARAANTIATVGSQKISADVYYQSLRQQLENLNRQFKQLNKNLIQQLNIPQQTLEQIIQQSLLLQKAKEMGIEATPDEIRAKIMSYPVFQKDGNFIGFQEYKKILDWNRIPLAKFEESLKKEIILDKFIKIISAGVVVTEDEIWQNYKTENESAKLEFVVIESDKIKLDKEPSSAEIKQYFEKNKSKFHIPEKREGIMVFLKTDELQPEIQLSEAEIEKYYNDNLSQFKEPEKIRVSRIYLPFQDKEKELVRAEAQGILDKIKSGQDFSALAEKYSKDEKAKEGGDWGLFDWRKLSPEEQQKINSMVEGETSGLIELKDGISILKIGQKTPSKTKPLEEVREKIKTILKEKKARDQAEKRISNLEKIAKKEKNLDVAAQKLGLKIRKTGFLKDGQAIEDIDPSGSISQSLFQLKEQQISSLIYTYKGVGVVQLKTIALPHAASFDEVKNEVKKQFIDREKKQKALEIMKKVNAELRSKNLEILAEKYGLEYKTAEEHKRGQYLSMVGENPEVDHLAFSLPIGEASQPVELENGYALLRVLGRKEVTRKDFEKNKNEQRKKLLEAKRNKFLQSYLYKLRNEMGVKIRYDLFLKINSDIMARFEGE